jgi:undecaprenyl-diphosphatase
VKPNRGIVQAQRARALAAVVAFVVAAAATVAVIAAVTPAPAAARCAPAAADTASATRRAPAAADSTSLDIRAFRALNGGIVNPVFDAVMPLATNFDKWRIAVLLIWCALVIFGKSRGRWAALMLIPIIAATDQISSHLLKPLVARVRPCDVLGGIRLWRGPEGWIITPAAVVRSYKSSFSFPSSHAANITASMLFLGLVYRRWLAPLAAVALVVSFSRIYVGVHWPSDALGGMALGAAIAAAAYALFRRLYREKPGKESATRPGPDTPPSE